MLIARARLELQVHTTSTAAMTKVENASMDGLAAMPLSIHCRTVRRKMSFSRVTHVMQPVFHQRPVIEYLPEASSYSL